MKRTRILFRVAAYFLGTALCAAEDPRHDKSDGGKRGGGSARSATSARKTSTARAGRPRHHAIRARIIVRPAKHHHRRHYNHPVNGGLRIHIGDDGRHDDRP